MIKQSILMACVIIPILNSDTNLLLTNMTLTSEPVLLLKTQKHLIKILETIIVRSRKTLSKEKLELLENELNRNNMEYMNAREDTERYFNNLINRIILIKRLSIDLDLIVRQGVGWKKDVSLIYPEYKDLEVSVCALAGLQRFYLLNVTQLAEGVLNTSISGKSETRAEFFSPMTASDCFVIGEVMYKNKLYKEGIPWMLEALRLYQKGKHDSYNMARIITVICKGYDALDDYKEYIQWTKKLIALKTQNNRALEDKMNFPDKFLQQSLVKRELQKRREKVIYSRDHEDSGNPCTQIKVTKPFELLCRGELSVNPDVSKKLICRYSVGHHPFYILAPFKTEQLFIQPDLILVHNMLSDNEINTLTHFASSQYVIKTEVIYERPRVYPLLKITALDGKQVRLLDRLTRRVTDFTGLRVNDSKWVVSKYDAGGHYNIHVDSSVYNTYNSRILRRYNLTSPVRKIEDDMLKQIFVKYKMFCRIASVLLYLSDVDQGGATVFSVLGVTVFPERGAALFWNNLLPTGDIDFTLCHGACPVLHGSKTIAQKWFPFENQAVTCPLILRKRKVEDIPPPKVTNKLK